MPKNLTTLVLNLIIAESQLHRNKLAFEVRELIETQFMAVEPLEIVLQRHFILLMKKYVATPGKSTADSLFALAQFYQDYLADNPAEKFFTAA